MGYLASFMAKEQITDYSEGLGEFLRHMRGFMDVEGGRFGKDFEALLLEKVLAKGRLYNTIDNTRTDPKRTAEQARAYRAARGIKDADA